MKKFGIVLIVISIYMCFTSFVRADTLEMKDGRLINGMYKGGTQHSIRFQADGKITVFPKADVLAITFSDVGISSSRNTQSVSKAPTQKPKSPKADHRQLTLKPGTKLPVRLLDSLYIESSKKGDWFKGMLDSDLVVDGVMIAPKGTRVNGQVVTAKEGRNGATMAITLRELIVKDQVLPLVTTNYLVQEEAAKNVFDLGVSTLKIVTRNRDVNIPYRSLIEFEMTKPLHIRFSQ